MTAKNGAPPGRDTSAPQGTGSVEGLTGVTAEAIVAGRERREGDRRRGWLGQYLANRENILGHRFTLNRDPAVAADQLVDQFEDTGRAIDYALELVDHLLERVA